MGLDTYLYAVEKDSDGYVDYEKLNYTQKEELGYWRKCYPLCDHFLEMNADSLQEDGNCKAIPVTVEEITEFLEIAKQTYFNESILGDGMDKYSSIFPDDIETLKEAVGKMQTLNNHNFYLYNWW